MSAKVEATIENLYSVLHNGKAEIVNGEVVLMPPTGDIPARAAFKIAVSLAHMEGKTPVEHIQTTSDFELTCPIAIPLALTPPGTRALQPG